MVSRQNGHRNAHIYTNKFVGCQQLVLGVSRRHWTTYKAECKMILGFRWMLRDAVGPQIWRTSQSASNPSLVVNSLLAGNLQGILRKFGRLARICPSERSKISLLEDNSLETRTGNFIAQNREFIETSREFAASCRELSAGRGKFPGRATTVGRVGVSLHRGQMGFFKWLSPRIPSGKLA